MASVKRIGRVRKASGCDGARLHDGLGEERFRRGVGGRVIMEIVYPDGVATSTSAS